MRVWMPDRIAIIKLGGLLEDQGGKVVGTQPGLLKTEFPPIGPLRPTGGFFNRMFGAQVPSGDGIALDLHLDKPNPAEGRLVLTAVFKVLAGGPPTEPDFWAARCEYIHDEMKKYLMAMR